MTVFGVCMAKDEADIIGPVVEHMLSQVDRLIVADNNSTDTTRDILSGYDLTLIDDPEQAYYQSRKMTVLARRAGAAGADWIVPFDADEIWVATGGRRLGDVLDGLPEPIMVAAADLYDHVTSSEDDLSDTDPVSRIGWRRDYPAPLAKVAVRWNDQLAIEQGNHGATYGAAVPARVSGLLAVRHFPYRSAEQFVTKARNGAAAYAATELPEEMGAHWRGYGRILDSGGPEALSGVYRTWFHLERPREYPGVVFDPAPRYSATLGV